MPTRHESGGSALRRRGMSSAKQPRVDDPTPRDKGGAQSSPDGILVPSPVAKSSSAVDTSGEKVPADTSRIKSLG